MRWNWSAFRQANGAASAQWHLLCRLSLRKRTFFRGAKDDIRRVCTRSQCHWVSAVAARGARAIAICLILLMSNIWIPSSLRAENLPATSSSQPDASQNIARHYRAGWPQCVSRWACPSCGCPESGDYVGGGAPFCGDARCPHEGTWGWDDNGRLFSKRIWLGWHHGRRFQGGTGAYRTDGH